MIYESIFLVIHRIPIKNFVLLHEKYINYTDIKEKKPIKFYSKNKIEI